MSEILTGDCTEKLAELPANSVHMCMTSPPYWNLRDYDHQDQLGLEEHSDAYVQNLCDALDGVKRVLRDDGSLWLNLGDTYENKDLQQIPARVALELQNRGWILRNRVTWNKPNPMPQSVKDRLNDTTEAIFHFVLNKSYWYDLDAIREPHLGVTRDFDGKGEHPADKPNHNMRGGNHPAGKNPGDVFDVTTKPFPDAHFAVYPPELCTKPIKATCPPKVCVECGAAYERETKEKVVDTREPEQGPRSSGEAYEGTNYSENKGLRHGFEKKNVQTVGWEQKCDCDTDTTEAGVALDPFAGAGTTLLKAKELGRDFIGIELNPEYADMARARVGLEPENPDTLRESDEQQGLEQF